MRGILGTPSPVSQMRAGLYQPPPFGIGLDSDLTPRSMELAQFASRPLLLGTVVALLIAFLMRETYPRLPGKAAGVVES